MTTTTTTVSAPGKILLAGGYTVLESPNVGVVLAVDKKFYSTVAKHAPISQDVATGTITVHSPQFGATWKYQAKVDEKSGLLLTADPENQSSNTFVEKTLRITLAYLRANAALCDLEITILADNDFYSVTPHLQARQWEATPENLAQLPKFLPCHVTSGSLQKTGLGSSAALTTSLVGALVLSLGTQATQMDMDDPTRRKIHNLAQICHCHAQGKVGSGFDVSSSSYGSHVYQRFPTCLLADFLADLDRHSAMSPSIIQTLQSLVDESPENFQWQIAQTPLPWNTDLLQIMLADVSGGSESPSMASQILKWRVSSDDKSCWNNLLTLNQQVVGLLEQIATSLQDTPKQHIEAMAKALSQSKLDSSDEPVGRLLCELRRTLLETRTNLKQMGELAGVPVEPDEQTQLANATMDLPGVVASLVPGAGGYDALVVLYVNTPQVRDQICELWRNYKDLAVCPLAVQYAPYGEGVTLEAAAPEYQGST